MKGGHKNRPQPRPDIANLDQSEIDSNQEVVPVQWGCGEMKYAVTWISQIHDQFTKDAPTQGKK